MTDLVEILTASNRMRTDSDWLAALQAYNCDHTGREIKAQLTKMGPITFNTFTVSSVSKLALILEYFSDAQREKYLESIDTLPAPSFSAQEWIEFLARCPVEESNRFVAQLSAQSCPDITGELGFFNRLMAHTSLFKNKSFENILSHLKQLQVTIPSIISPKFKLHELRYGGGDKNTLAQKIALTLKYIQDDLPNFSLSIQELAECLSLKIGALQYHKDIWLSIKASYLKGLSAELPYLFYSESQVQLFYEKLAKENERTEYGGQTGTKKVTFDSVMAKQEFEDHELVCFEQLPNAYRFLSQYKNDYLQPSAKALIGLLVQDAFSTNAKVEELDELKEHAPIQQALEQLIQNTARLSSQTSWTYLSHRFQQKPEDQLAFNLSKLDDHWLAILNTHIPSLNWEPSFTTEETEACFKSYIDSVGLKLHPEQSYTTLIEMLAALALSVATLALGVVILSTLSVPVGAAMAACGLGATGFFAYKALNTPLNLPEPQLLPGL